HRAPSGGDPGAGNGGSPDEGFHPHREPAADAARRTRTTTGTRATGVDLTV
ncbi:MAG: hypothetical protein HOQ45_08990, partial [Nocardioidaceae bacterium]|nr:hypothetical protein [Nocardioidaceae bacterium]